MARHLRVVPPASEPDTDTGPDAGPSTTPATAGGEAVEPLAEFNAELDRFKEKAWAEATREAYGYWFTRFVRWCENPEIRWDRRVRQAPVFSPLPADPRTVEWFIYDLANGPDEDHPDFEHSDWEIAPATVEQVISAIRWHHLRARHEPPINDDVRTLKRAIVTNSTRLVTRAYPLVIADLRILGDWLHTQGQHPLRGVRDRLVFCLYRAGHGQTAITRLQVRDVLDQQFQAGADSYLREAIAAWLTRLPLDGDDLLIPRLAGSTVRPGEPMSREQVQQILRRVARDAGYPNWTSSQDITAEMYEAVNVWAVELRDPGAIRDHACTVTMFGFGLRRTEAADTRIEHATFQRNALGLYIPRSKTDQRGKGVRLVFPHMADPLVDGTVTLRRWLDLVDSRDPKRPLFTTIDKDGRISNRPLTPNSISKMIRRRVLDAGLVADEDEAARYSGHSPRRGLITSLTEAGLTPNQIKVQSRHKNLHHLAVYADEVHLARAERNPLRALNS